MLQIGLFRSSVLFLISLEILHIVYAQYDTNPCLNDGLMLPNGTCSCKVFNSGPKCEISKCDRTGVLRSYSNGKVNGSRCICAPGWYSVNCQISGWRPAAAENVDITKRSLIVVFNVKDTMKPYFSTFLANINSTVSNLLATPESTLYRFTICTFVTQMKGQNKTDLWTFTNYNDFYAKLAQIGKSSFVTSDSQYQDLLGALFYAQQQTDNMAFAQTWLFADSLPTDNFPENTLMSSGSIENLLIQTTLNWRTKMTVFLCQDDSKPISLKGDAHYNILYRIIRATHGDIFLVNGNELKPALQNVLSTYQNVEDIAAYYDFQPVDSISFEVHQDTVSQTMYLMIWIKPDSNAVSAPNVNATNANLQKLNSGKYFAFYKLTPSEGQIHVSVTTSADVSFNVRCFVQSRGTVILNYNASPKIDFGNGFAWAGIPMWTAIRPLNIDSVAYVSRTVRAPDGYPVTEKVCSELKPLEASIAPYLMNVWNDSCPPGALTTEVNIYRNDNSYIRRILAGYCSSAVTHNADSTDSQESSGRIPNTYGPSFAKLAITQKDAAITCPNTNVDAAGDKRQWEFRQTLFIFEKSSALKEASSKIFQLLNDSLPSWEQSGYTPKQYGFMAFDDQDASMLLSNFDIQTFLTKLQPTTVNLNYKSTKASRVLDAIYLATQLILVPPMMINVILNQDSAILPLNYNFSLVDKNIQINIFSFSPSGQYSAFPKDERLTSWVRQSGGRFMPLQLDDHVVTTNFIKSVFMEKQLVMDERVSDCSSGKNFSFLIDTESQYATLKAVGSSANLKVFDANNVPIQFNGANGVVNLVSSNGVQIFEIDLSKANIAKGQWTASMSTDKGECGLQVRIVGPYTVVPGFSSTNSNDFPMMQLFGARGKKNGAASIMFRLFTQSNGNKTMALNNVKYLGTSVQDQFNESNDNKNWQTMKINSRDATSCTYQYATDVFNLPLNPLVKLVVYGSVGNSQLQRTFYYYQDSDVTRCKNSKPDDFGICQCPQNYIGDFCQTPVCLNGAFESFGICGCVNGYYGDNCEIPITLKQWPTIPPHGPTPLPELTTPSFTYVQYKYLSSIIVILLLSVFF